MHNCKHKTTNEEINKETNTTNWATMVIQHNKWIIKLLIAAVIVSNICIAAVTLAILAFLNGYSFESIEVECKDGTAIYQNTEEGDNTVNGQSESKENDAKGQK